MSLDPCKLMLYQGHSKQPVPIVLSPCDFLKVAISTAARLRNRMAQGELSDVSSRLAGQVDNAQSFIHLADAPTAQSHGAERAERRELSAGGGS